MDTIFRTPILMGLTVALATSMSIAQSKQEKRFNSGSKPTVSVLNDYGPVSVRPGTSNQVIVIYTLASKAVEVDSNQSGDRITIQTHVLQAGTPQASRVDYELIVPPDASVTISSADGPIVIEKLRGDVSVEGATAPVDIREISEAHVHVKTLSGPVHLANVRQGHVEITSVSGSITLDGVSGPIVSANSASGKISYDGDFGDGGSYKLTSHTGDIEASLPADASVDLTAHTAKGTVDSQYPLQPKSHSMFPTGAGRLVGTTGRAASSVLLNSISGKIHLKKH